MRVALIQMRSGVDAGANVAAMREGVGEAAARGAAYVQTPEMTGAVDRDGRALLARSRPEADDPVVHAASDLAREHGVWLHVGSTAVLADAPGVAEGKGEGKLANRALLFAPDGRIAARYDKLHMFDVDLPGGETWRESRLYAPGERAVVARVGEAVLGLSICYDLRFPALYAALAGAGASVLAVPAAFTARTGRDHWEVLLRARAIECGAWVLAAAQGGRHEDGRETWGRSAVVDPWGAVVASLDHDEPGVLVADIDVARSADARARIANLAHARPFGMPAPAAAHVAGDNAAGGVAA